MQSSRLLFALILITIRHLRALPELPEPTAIDCLRTLGLIGCARSGSLPPISDSPGPLPTICCCCDSLKPDSKATIREYRNLTSQPLEAFGRISSKIFDSVQIGDKLRLTALQSLQRVVRHTLLGSIDVNNLRSEVFEAIFREIELASKSIRTAAG